MIFSDLYLREIIRDERGVDKHDLPLYSVACVAWRLGSSRFHSRYRDFAAFLARSNIFKTAKLRRLALMLNVKMQIFSKLSKSRGKSKKNNHSKRFSMHYTKNMLWSIDDIFLYLAEMLFSKLKDNSIPNKGLLLVIFYAITERTHLKFTFF